MAEVNTRPHRVTRRPPVEMLAEEHEHLHRLPQVAAHDLFRADAQGQLAVDDLGRRRALLGPARAGRRARVGHGSTASELIVVHVDGPAGPREVARHRADHAGPPGDLR